MRLNRTLDAWMLHPVSDWMVTEGLDPGTRILALGSCILVRMRQEIQMAWARMDCMLRLRPYYRLYQKFIRSIVRLASCGSQVCKIIVHFMFNEIKSLQLHVLKDEAVWQLHIYLNRFASLLPKVVASPYVIIIVRESCFNNSPPVHFAATEIQI